MVRFGPRAIVAWAEVATILVLAVLAVWSVRPLLEEWGLFLAFERSGLGYMATIFPQIALRPLHLLPSAMQWLIADGKPVGVGLTTACLIAARYLAVRWAVTPLMNVGDRWVFATLGTVLLTWPGFWLARFSPAQASAILFFLIVGCSVRLALRQSARYSALSSVCLLGVLTIYQAPILLAAVLPFAAGFWVPDGHGRCFKSRALRFLRVGLPLLSAVILYAIYAGATLVFSSRVYEGGMAEGLLSLSSIATNISLAYATVYLTNPLTLPALLLVLSSCCLLHGNPREASVRLALFVVGALCVLPLFSLVYPSTLHLRDPERALFPAALGMSLIVLPLLARSKPASSPSALSAAPFLIVTALLSSSLLGAFEARQAWLFQRQVLMETIETIRTTGASKILMRDTTGELGDVYTFLGQTLTQALALQGITADVLICTPDEVDRDHPVAARYPIPSTPSCSEADSGDREPFTATGGLGGISVQPSE